jgi:hypothetical protein
VDAKAPGSIGARRDYAALVRLPADGERLAAQRWIMLFFDGTEKGVKVEVKDGSRHRLYACRSD